MSDKDFLNGQILIAQPVNQDNHFAKTVVLIAQHNHTGAWGVVVNKPSKTVSMTDIMSAVGIDYVGQETVYIGGPVEPNRVHVIHTLDWSSPSTMQITKDIGITGDVSILAAIKANEGPALYRAGVGLAVWSAGQLDGEQSGQAPWTKEHIWLTTPATVDLCLQEIGDDQWQNAIDAALKNKIADLF